MILGLCISRQIDQICDIHVANPNFPLLFRGLTSFFVLSIVKEGLNFFENHEKSKLMRQGGQLLPNYDQLVIPAQC